MVAPDQMHLFWVADLECKQQANGFEGVATTIDEVTKEQIVEALDVTVLAIVPGLSPQIEETHKIAVLTMDITEDLDRRLD